MLTRLAVLAVKLAEFEANQTKQRLLYDKIMDSQTRLPRDHLDFLILQLQINQFESQGPHKNKWEEPLKSAKKLKELLTVQPRDKAGVIVLKQEVTAFVESELETLEIAFNLDGLEHS